jgi:hypothetical protein
MAQKVSVPAPVLRGQLPYPRLLLLDRGDDIETASIRVQISAIGTRWHKFNEVSASLVKEGEQFIEEPW